MEGVAADDLWAVHQGTIPGGEHSGTLVEVTETAGWEVATDRPLLSCELDDLVLGSSKTT